MQKNRVISAFLTIIMSTGVVVASSAESAFMEEMLQEKTPCFNLSPESTKVIVVDPQKILHKHTVEV